MSVPIPDAANRRIALKVTLFPAAGGLVQLSAWVPRNGSIGHVERALAGSLPSRECVMLSDVYRSRIHRLLPSATPLSDIRPDDQVFAYEVAPPPAPDPGGSLETITRTDSIKSKDVGRLPVYVMHRKVMTPATPEARPAERREIFGLPFILTCTHHMSYQDLAEAISQSATRFDVERTNPNRKPGFTISIVNNSGTSCGACDQRKCPGCSLPKTATKLRLRSGTVPGDKVAQKVYIALDWVSGRFDEGFGENITEDTSVSQVRLLENAARRSVQARTSQDTEDRDSVFVPLTACVDAYTAPEELRKEEGNGIKCEKCKEEASAVKRLSIWREPDVLIVHIKRFHRRDDGYHYEKLDTPIDFARSLDLRPWITGPAFGSTIYDLYAITLHSGGLSGGHYVAACHGVGVPRVPIEDPATSSVWAKYNDAQVVHPWLDCQTEETARQCYVLFFAKRRPSSSNLITYGSSVT